MILSKRLHAIAKLINENEVVYDVGTDHGLLPCFLVVNGLSKAYASDIKEKPLNKAKENIQRFHLEDKVIPVLYDGVDTNKSDVTTLVFAGMGFYTVKQCLDKLDLSKYSKIIIQINNNVKKLREYISNNEYLITDEVIVKDDFYYEIVVFNTNKGRKLSDIELEFGPINIEKGDDTFIEYLRYEKDKLRQINQAKYDLKINLIDSLLLTYNK